MYTKFLYMLNIGWIFFGILAFTEIASATSSGENSLSSKSSNESKLLLCSELSNTPVDFGQRIPIDVDSDGDCDILEHWLNGKRLRWLDENDDMKWSDIRGDLVSDSVQIDIDGDGFYDGLSDMTVKWLDADDDGDADLQFIVVNRCKDVDVPKIDWSSHYMVFIDVDDDNVLGFIDWQNWKSFLSICWRFTGATNFSPDYNGDALFLKVHAPPQELEDPRYNWENPFAFYDFDQDGCTEMSIRICDDDPSMLTPDGLAESAFVSYDMDNDSQRGNEMDYDMTLLLTSGEKIDYRKWVHKYPTLLAAKWVMPYMRHTGWRRIDELIYIPHEKCYEEIFKPQWGKCRLVFDEDDDDHRWERVELYSPLDPYIIRKKSYDMNSGGMCSNPQSDTLGDRGEFDEDFSGKGKLYIGKWDKKIHLYGAESGAWTVDYDARYWGGGSPGRYNSSPEIAPKAQEVVRYEDTDGNGFFDRISYDYDGDKIVDLQISLLDYADEKNPAQDVCELISPASEQWQGMHKLFIKITAESWREALVLYRATWKKGLTTAELDDLAIASSTAEKYNNAYWLKEKIFRLLDKRFKTLSAKEKQKLLYKYYFTGNIDSMVNLIADVEFHSSCRGRGENNRKGGTIECK